MAKLVEIKVINVDETSFNVADMIAEIQEHVAQYNAWRQETEDKRIKLFQVECALKTLGNEILGLIRAEVKKAEDAAEAAEAAISVDEVLVPADPGC